MEKPGIKDLSATHFYGFDQIEREVRCDYEWHGKASEYAKAKEEILRARPHQTGICQEIDCLIVGAACTLMGMRDSVTIVHGPVSCAHYLAYVCGVLYDARMVSTQMTDRDALMGAEARLKEAIQQAVAIYKPSVVCVVGTCTSSVIGEDISGICKTMESETGIPMFGFDASGFRHRTWNYAAEEAMISLIDRVKPNQPKVKDSVNVFNLPVVPANWKEFFEVLGYFFELGIKINLHLPLIKSYQGLIDMFTQAEINLTRCPSWGLLACEYAEKTLGMPYLRVPRPIGVEHTERFVREIAGFFGKESPAEALIEREKKRIAPRLEKARRKLSGKRFAIITGPGQAIPQAQFAADLGMEIVLLSVYKVDPILHDLLAEFVANTGQDPEFIALRNLPELEPILARLKPDVLMGMPDDRVIMTAMGVPTIDHFGNSYPTKAGFEGAALLAEQWAIAVDNKLDRDYGKYLRPPKSSPLFVTPEFMRCSPQATGQCLQKKQRASS